MRPVAGDGRQALRATAGAMDPAPVAGDARPGALQPGGSGPPGSEGMAEGRAVPPTSGAPHRSSGSVRGDARPEPDAGPAGDPGGAPGGGTVLSDPGLAALAADSGDGPIDAEGGAPGVGAETAPVDGAEPAPSGGDGAGSAGQRPAPAPALGAADLVRQFAAAGVPGQGRGAAAAGGLAPLLDVPLELSVELGRTRRPVRDILALVPGSIVPLERLAGDPVDVLVNGRRIARGEVVVVDESFGVRITDIPAGEARPEAPA